MARLSYDLHIHSCLSPCGHEDMTPSNIVYMAKLKGLDMIALTDHNSVRNCPAFFYHGKEAGILTIAGMELCTREEVHVLCLFTTLEDAIKFDEYVWKRLPNIRNREDIFGTQFVLNEKDEVIEKIDKLLINGTDISFDDVYEITKKYNGIMIPAHIDKGANSVISNLGFIPPDSKFMTVELSDNYKGNPLVENDRYGAGCKKIYNSDAHELGAIHEAIYFLEVEEKSVEAVLKALQNRKESLDTF